MRVFSLGNHQVVCEEATATDASSYVGRGSMGGLLGAPAA